MRGEIEAALKLRPGDPMSAADLAALILGASRDVIRDACEAMRAEGVLGRKGAGSAERPFRYYLKSTLRRRRDA